MALGVTQGVELAEEFVGFHFGELMSGFETSYLGELYYFCCLDSIACDAMMRTVRTTVTIDADTAALLQEEVARTGLSFKEVLNRAVRRALGPRTKTIKIEPVFPAAFPDFQVSFNRLADSWDDEETLRELSS